LWGLSLAAFFYSGYADFRNKFLLALLAFIPLSIKFSITTDYRLLCYIFVVVLAASAVRQKDAEKSLPFFLWAITLISVYAILQAMGFEGAQIINASNRYALHTTAKDVTSMLGHPIFTGALIAMFIPLALKVRKWWMAAVMAIAVLCTKSDMAIGSMIVSLVSLPLLKSRKGLLIGLTLAAVIFSAIILNFDFIDKHTNDSGRYKHWRHIIDTVNADVVIHHKHTGETTTKKYNLLGWGVGSYKTFGAGNGLSRAHNEYLHCFAECGIVGLVLFLAFLFSLLWYGQDMYTRCAVVCICLNAGGLFVWQIAPVLFASLYVLWINKKESNVLPA
jgi:O-antigen ligase